MKKILLLILLVGMVFASQAQGTKQKKNLDLAALYNSTGLWHYQKGEYGDALEWFDKVLAIWENEPEEQNIQIAAA